MGSGVYEIVNAVNNKRYIGSAVDIENRFNVHRWGLDNGLHHNRHLQRAWNKYGETHFMFRVIEIVPLPELINREQLWIDKLKPEYNIALKAGNTLGVKYPPDVRRKLTTQRIGKLNHFYGKKHKPETKQKMSDWQLGEGNHQSKLTEDDVINIRKLYKDGYTQQKIADTFNISRGHAGNIVLNKTWKHVSI